MLCRGKTHDPLADHSLIFLKLLVVPPRQTSGKLTLTPAWILVLILQTRLMIQVPTKD
jgi:hypothetical protein